MVWFLRNAFKNPRMEVTMTRHAEVIRDEITQLNEEFKILIARSGIVTPTIHFLMDQFNRKAPLLPDGSRSIRLRWSDLVLPVLILCLLVLTLIYIF